MQSPSLNAYADYETKILPTSRPSCQTLWQTSLITTRQLHGNFLIVFITSICDSALELEKSKGCKLSPISARDTECVKSEPANLACYKRPQRKSIDTIRDHYRN